MSEQADALALLAEMEWRGFTWEVVDGERPACPSCSGVKPDPEIYPDDPGGGHTPGCRLAALLGR